MRANHCVYYQSPAVNLERVDLGLISSRPLAAVFHISGVMKFSVPQMVFMVFRMVWSAQVAQLQDGVRVLAGRQQDVLRFEVPMADLPGMEVGDISAH